MAIVNNAAGAAAVNIQDGGNSITVDGTVAATQSGTWVLGANSGVDIGDVTINNAAGAAAVNIQDGGNSITVDGTVSIGAFSPGTGATDLGKAEDAPHTTGDVGVFALAVYNATDAAPVSADGDYSQISVDVAGRVKVNLGTGNVGATGPLKEEDAARVGGGYGILGLAIRNDALATLVSTDLDYSGISADLFGRTIINGQRGWAELVTQDDYPVVTGGEARYTDPVAVSDGEITRNHTDPVGKSVNMPYASGPRQVRGSTGAFNSAANQALFPAPGVSEFNNVSTITLANSSATLVVFSIKSGSTSFYDVVVDAETSETIEFLVPLKVAIGDPVNVSTDSAVADAYASATGFISVA